MKRDAWTEMEGYIERGEAWHVGVTPLKSQYICAVEADAIAYAKHLNELPGMTGFKVRSQSEINAFHAARAKTA